MKARERERAEDAIRRAESRRAEQARTPRAGPRTRFR
jgi:hypothetical protein